MSVLNIRSGGSGTTPRGTPAYPANSINQDLMIQALQSAMPTGTSERLALTVGSDSSLDAVKYDDGEYANITVSGTSTTHFVEYVANGAWVGGEGHRVYTGGTITLFSIEELEGFLAKTTFLGMRLIVEYSKPRPLP